MNEEPKNAVGSGWRERVAELAAEGRLDELKQLTESIPTTIEAVELAELQAKYDRLAAAVQIKHKWQSQNRGYQYARYICTVCELKSDDNDDERLCGCGIAAYLEAKEKENE